MLVDSTDEVGSDIDWILREGLAIGGEAGSGQVLGHRLVWIQQELDSVHGRIAPVDLTTPLELRGILLIVQDERWNLGLTATLEACEGRDKLSVWCFLMSRDIWSAFMYDSWERATRLDLIPLPGGRSQF